MYEIPRMDIDEMVTEKEHLTAVKIAIEAAVTTMRGTAGLIKYEDMQDKLRLLADGIERGELDTILSNINDLDDEIAFAEDAIEGRVDPHPKPPVDRSVFA